jgi:2-C-methyl-D-erythritol 2,4-cyclodiphosphate synthase
MRIGHGYDVHGFTSGNGIVLGGIFIPCDFSIEAHSDGDVVIHAICDALLGAAALGDIGQHFPDNDANNKQRDSREFLRHIISMLEEKCFRVGNVDVTVIAQAPRLRKYIDSMRTMLADDLKIGFDDINIKATTTEGLGYIGRKEGMAVHAVVLLEKNSAVLADNLRDGGL